MKKTIVIGNKIKLTLGATPSKNITGKMRVLNELIGYLYCFLGGNVYPGNTLQTTKTIAKMLQNASLLKNCTILKFSFPKKIRDQFNLDKCYSISLIDTDVFEFYCEDLLPKVKLSCILKIDATGKEHKYAFRRIQRMIINSDHYLKSVIIQKSTIGFVTTVKSRIKNIDDVIIEPQKDLISAIYKLQEVLLPLTEEEIQRKKEREQALAKLQV